MSPQIDDVIARAKLAADRPESGGSNPTAERQRLERLASEFESMLMVQVLKDMRRAGRWDDEEEGGDMAGTQSLFEMLDVELASQMTRAQGFGLTRQMLDSFDRLHAGGAPVTAAAVMDVLANGGRTVEGGVEGADTPDLPIAPSTPTSKAGVEASEITSAFGWRRDPLTGETRFHRGVDLRAAYGQDVPASADGRVVYSGSQGSYGTTVVLEHANGTQTRYTHLSVSLVRQGEAVGAGQLVGRAGSSGRATGPHVHFEVLDSNGTPVNPVKHTD